MYLIFVGCLEKEEADLSLIFACSIGFILSKASRSDIHVSDERWSQLLALVDCDIVHKRER